MLAFAQITRKRLFLTTIALPNLIALVRASTNIEDLPQSLTADPGPPEISNEKTQGWPGIVQWTSLGDSYATGVGVGESKGADRCVQFSDSYPLLMNKDSRMPGEADGRKLWDCTCSGATTQDILDHQFLNTPAVDPVWGARSEFGAPQVATLTAGGDDLDFLSLVLYCILHFYPWSNPCEEQIKRSNSLLNGDKFFNSLDLVIKQILVRGITAAGEGFKLFVTGYAQFFNEKTDQCDNTSFTFWDRFGEEPKLTKDLRQKLNKIARDLNSKIRSVVDNNKQWGVVYVDYDSKFEGHRYCEEGVTEPDPNNPNTWFFHPGSEGNGRTRGSDDLLASKLDPDGSKDNFYQTLKDKASLGGDDLTKHNPYDDWYGNNLHGEDNMTIKSGTIRIFHPTRSGIDAIVSRIFKAFPAWPKPDVASIKELDRAPPQPTCEQSAGSKKFDIADAKKAIDEFCNDQSYWPFYLVSPVAQTENGVLPKSPGFTKAVDLPNTDNVVLQLAWDQGKGCAGFSLFTGANGDSECHDRFTSILDDCDPGSTIKQGGYLSEDNCLKYSLGVFPGNSIDPFPLKDARKPQNGFLDAFRCEDTYVAFPSLYLPSPLSTAPLSLSPPTLLSSNHQLTSPLPKA
ncbi:MAG: hypothetical protein Q9226_003859, partial [Calogaya cf. arnoldii]